MATLPNTIDAIIKVPLPNTTLTVNVRPVFTRQFHVRMALGMFFLRMAAWVLGCNISAAAGASLLGGGRRFCGGKVRGR